MTGRPLSPQQARFVELYIGGPADVRGNATQSYLAAYPSCYSIDSAAQSGSRLLRHDKVRARMRELRKITTAECIARLRPWMELAPDAQETLRAAGAGELVFPDADPKLQPELIRSAVRAASEILDRALGTTKQMHDHRVGGGIVVAIAGPPQVAPELESGNGSNGYLPPA